MSNKSCSFHQLRRMILIFFFSNCIYFFPSFSQNGSMAKSKKIEMKRTHKSCLCIKKEQKKAFPALDPMKVRFHDASCFLSVHCVNKVNIISVEMILDWHIFIHYYHTILYNESFSMDIPAIWIVFFAQTKVQWVHMHTYKFIVALKHGKNHINLYCSMDYDGKSHHFRGCAFTFSIPCKWLSNIERMFQ